MLVLARREDESIDCSIDISAYIDNNAGQSSIPLKIHVLDINGGQVKLGLDALAAVSIIRSELLEEED